MAKHSLILRPLDAFRLVTLLNVAKPRRTSVKESLTPLQDNVASFLTKTDAKELIEDAVIEAITETVNFPPPVSNAQLLADMGYTAPTYAKLASELTTVIQHYKASEVILRSEIVSASTVGGCIDLVTGKAGV